MSAWSPNFGKKRTTPSPFGFTCEDVEDERQAYHDAVILARHFQDAGMEPERLACRERARRHMGRADRIEALLPPTDNGESE